jgi:hypothetical protein
VIDANILRSAGGEEAVHPTSAQCRAVLSAILNICHKATVCSELREEWDKHQSKYATLWRSAMQKKRKIITIEVTEKSGLRQTVSDFHEQARTKQEAALKDFHLVEAAIETDWIVISLDDTVRKIFAEACQEGDQLAKVIWVHPSDEDILVWLENGAIPQDNKRLLAYNPDS